MAEHDSVVDLARQLIREVSVSPRDGDCQKILGSRLTTLGFAIENLPFGEVSNLYAFHGSGDPLFVFAGHTDVVPAGPRDEWSSDPFEPTLIDGTLYGRGAADMKGALAAMVTAMEAFISQHPRHRGTLGVLITSDEEADAVDGTVKALAELTRQGRQIRWCLVGEPTCASFLGDTIKIGRRGSLNGHLLVRGVQGHVAYPQQADNPIHRGASALAALAAASWDDGNDDFPATSLQITNLSAGTGITNVIPGQMSIRFNLRFSPESTVASIQHRIRQILDAHQLDYKLEWQVSGLPFHNTAPGLVDAVSKAIARVTGQQPQRSTTGGTSDGRFIAPTGAEVVEFGPINASIHKANENVFVADLRRLADIYRIILEEMLT